VIETVKKVLYIILCGLTMLMIVATPVAMFLIWLAVAVGSQKRFETEIFIHFEILAVLPLLAIGCIWLLVHITNRKRGASAHNF